MTTMTTTHPSLSALLAPYRPGGLSFALATRSLAVSRAGMARRVADELASRKARAA